MMKFGLAIGLLAAGYASSALPAVAQDAREAQLVGFHALCNQGDKKACVRFGMMLQQNTDKHAEWRRGHPEFFFFER